MIAIVDYGMGNLRSVQKALARVGLEAQISSSPQDVQRARAVVLPGVGAFGQAMDNLRARGLDRAVMGAIESGTPFLGICLGLQLLFAESEEFGPVRGLGLVPGRVVRFGGPAFARADDALGAQPLKVPHMGWNSARPVSGAPHLRGLAADTMFYFVHSYYGVPEDPSWIATLTRHGVEFASALWRENVFASQFHPEKSGPAGLKLLTNFAALTREV